MGLFNELNERIVTAMHRADELQTANRRQARRIGTLKGLLLGWQDLMEDGPPNCGDNEATEHWEKVDAALTK